MASTFHGGVWAGNVVEASLEGCHRGLVYRRLQWIEVITGRVVAERGGAGLP